MDNTSRAESALLTALEVAERLEVSAETVRRWAREGKLRGVEFPSGRRRYRAADVDAMLRGPADEPAGAA